MERSVHARNGKVWMPDRKLQIGNCFEEDKKYLVYFNRFELLNICLMTSLIVNLLEIDQIIYSSLRRYFYFFISSFSQTDLFLPHIFFTVKHLFLHCTKPKWFLEGAVIIPNIGIFGGVNKYVKEVAIIEYFKKHIDFYFKKQQYIWAYKMV